MSFNLIIFIRGYDMPKRLADTKTNSLELLPVNNDYVFCRLFGVWSNRQVLVKLLNAILDGEPYIKDIQLDQTEYKKATPDGKTVRLDIVATTDDGTIIDIEMQCANEGNIVDRSIYYQSRLVAEQLQKGEDYSDLPNIISIWIAKAPVTDMESCYHEFLYMYKPGIKEPVSIASLKSRHIIIELSKLEAAAEHLSKRRLLDKFLAWMQFIKNPSIISYDLLDKYPEVSEAMRELRKMSMSKEERSSYEARLREQNRYYAVARSAEKRGIAEGIERGLEKGMAKGKAEGIIEGIAKGKADAKKQVAKELSKVGLSIKQISEATGLTAQEIEELR